MGGSRSGWRKPAYAQGEHANCCYLHCSMLMCCGLLNNCLFIVKKCNYLSAEWCLCKYVSVCLHKSGFRWISSLKSEDFRHCHSSPFHISPAYETGTFYFICLPSAKVWMIDGPTSASLCPFIRCPVLRTANSSCRQTLK